MPRSFYTRRASTRQPRPLDAETLQALALRYVGRYATTRAKLIAYLTRKIGEREWTGEAPPNPAALTDRFVELGYIDDRGFAATRGQALTRRGYGGRRVEADLRAAGINEADREEASRAAYDSGRDAALALARRRRIGPYSDREPDRALRDRWIATLIRAGHDFDLAREIAYLRDADVNKQE